MGADEGHITNPIYYYHWQSFLCCCSLGPKQKRYMGGYNIYDKQTQKPDLYWYEGRYHTRTGAIQFFQLSFCFSSFLVFLS